MKRVFRCLLIDVATSYRENLAYNMVMRRLAWIAVLASPVLGATQEYVAEVLPAPFATFARAIGIDSGVIAGYASIGLPISFIYQDGRYHALPRGFFATSFRDGVVGLTIYGGEDCGYWVDGRFISLKPHDAAVAGVLGVRGSSIQGGYIRARLGDKIPYIWRGSRESGQSLLPLGWFNGAVTDVTETIQVGGASAAGRTGACVWFGSAESARFIHPDGYSHSEASSIEGDQIVGFGYIAGGADHAILWRLPDLVAESLHPSNATRSYAYDTNGTQQCGSATIDGIRRAVIWSGSRDRFVDLHRLLPRGFRSSVALAIDSDGVAVGYAIDARGFDRVVRWRKR